MSKPFNYFQTIISRAEGFLYHAQKHEGCKDDVIRGAVVLAVAAYDHYFTSKFCDVLSSYLHKNEPNKELIQLLDRAGLNTKSALEIAVMKRPFRRIRSLLTSFLSGKTTNRTKSIDSLFAAIDLKGLSGRVHKETNRKTLGKRIDGLVDTRNSIVHSAHLNSHGKPKAIHIEDTRARIGELVLFVTTCEELINVWVIKSELPGLASSTD